MPNVVFAKSKKTFAWDGSNNLLEFAENHGIHIDSGCRCGADTVCMTKLLDGQVNYVQEPLAQAEPGHILPCICVPVGDIRLEA